MPLTEFLRAGAAMPRLCATGAGADRLELGRCTKLWTPSPAWAADHGAVRERHRLDGGLAALRLLRAGGR